MSLLTHVKTVEGQQREIVIALVGSKLKCFFFIIKYPNLNDNSYTKCCAKWLMNHCKFFKIPEFLHSGDFLFNCLHLQLDSVVAVLVFLRLVVESTNPT